MQPNARKPLPTQDERRASEALEKLELGIAEHTTGPPPFPPRPARTAPPRSQRPWPGLSARRKGGRHDRRLRAREKETGSGGGEGRGAGAAGFLYPNMIASYDALTEDVAVGLGARPTLHGANA